MMRVTVYGKPSCPQCTATTRALEASNIEYLYVDLTADAEAVRKVLALGYKQAPVVVAGDDHWCGFRPDKLSEQTSKAGELERKPREKSVMEDAQS